MSETFYCCPFCKKRGLKRIQYNYTSKDSHVFGCCYCNASITAHNNTIYVISYGSYRKGDSEK